VVRYVYFQNAFTQGAGLMFRKPAPKTAYVFPFGRAVKVGFHMWFVFSPIDLYLLDEHRRIIEVKRSFRPFTSYRPTRTFWFAVETAAGAFSWRAGDHLPLRW